MGESQKKNLQGKITELAYIAGGKIYTLMSQLFIYKYIL
jgi:hypothetical protein